MNDTPLTKRWLAAAVVQMRKEYPPCDGYPDCDGDLEGEPHQPYCPAFNKTTAQWRLIAIEERAKRLAAEDRNQTLATTLERMVQYVEDAERDHQP